MAALESASHADDDRIDRERAQDLRRSLRDVAQALRTVTEALNRIDPELQVHQPQVARDLDSALSSRGTVVNSMAEELEAVRHLSPAVVTTCTFKRRRPSKK